MSHDHFYGICESKCLVDITPYVLFDGTETKDNVSLSDNPTNYKKLDIYFRNDDNEFSSTSVYNPQINNLIALCSMDYYEYNSKKCFSCKTKTLKIVSNALNVEDYGCLDVQGTASTVGGATASASGTSESNNRIYIKKVVGYKNYV